MIIMHSCKCHRYFSHLIKYQYDRCIIIKPEKNNPNHDEVHSDVAVAQINARLGKELMINDTKED